MSEKNEVLKIEISNIDKCEKDALIYLIDKMVYDGNIGHSEEITFFADGDGSFRPKAKIDDKKLEYSCDRANYSYIHDEHEMDVFNRGSKTYISPYIIYALHEFPDEPMTYVDRKNDAFVAYWVPENSEYSVGDIVRDSDAWKLKPGIRNVADIDCTCYVERKERLEKTITFIEKERAKNGMSNFLMRIIFKNDDAWQYFKDNMFANVPEIKIKPLDIIFNNLKMYYQNHNDMQECSLFSESKEEIPTISYVLFSEINSIYFSFKLAVDFITDIPDFVSLQPLIKPNDNVLVSSFDNDKININKISLSTMVKKINYNTTVNKDSLKKLFKDNKSMHEFNEIIYENIKNIFYTSILTNIFNELDFSRNDEKLMINLTNYNLYAINNELDILSEIIYKNIKKTPNYIICSEKTSKYIDYKNVKVCVVNGLNDNIIYIGYFDETTIVYAPYIMEYNAFVYNLVKEQESIAMYDYTCYRTYMHNNVGKITLINK